jgi:hypothetical protein
VRWGLGGELVKDVSGQTETIQRDIERTLDHALAQMLGHANPEAAAVSMAAAGQRVKTAAAGAWAQKAMGNAGVDASLRVSVGRGYCSKRIPDQPLQLEQRMWR